MLNTDAELPLPSDRPHIGTYTTNFERIFAGQSSPAGTRLIHRTLPLQFQAMGVRLEAIHAAQEALQTVNKAYLAGQVDVGQLFAAMRSVTDQKRAWLASVCQYNHAIADYALAVVGSETVGRELVSVLIKLSGAEPKRTGTGDGVLYPKLSTGVEQADYETPVPAAPEANAEEPKRPTLAPARDELTDAPPSPWAPAPKNLGDGQNPTGNELPAEETPAAAPAEPPPPRRSPLHCMTSPPRLRRSVCRSPIGRLRFRSDPWSRWRRQTSRPDSGRSTCRPRKRQALGGSIHPSTALTRRFQAKRLALRLHAAGENGPEGKPVGLEACLKGLSARQRQPVLEAYWVAAMRLAEHRVYRQHIQLLDDLVQVVTLGDAGTPERRHAQGSAVGRGCRLAGGRSPVDGGAFELTQRPCQAARGPLAVADDSAPCRALPDAARIAGPPVGRVVGNEAGGAPFPRSAKTLAAAPGRSSKPIAAASKPLPPIEVGSCPSCGFSLRWNSRAAKRWNFSEPCWPTINRSPSMPWRSSRRRLPKRSSWPRSS